MKLRTFLFFSFTLAAILNISAQSNISTSKQNRTIDSLLTLIKVGKADTNEVNHLILLCKEYRKSGDHENGLKYCNKAISLASSIRVDNKTGWLKGISLAYTNKGNVYLDISNYSEALNNYNAALKITKLTNDKGQIAYISNQIGTIYLYKGNYQEALNNYFTSLELRRQINDNKGIADSYLNIGTVYYHLADYSEALKYYLTTLKIAERIKNKQLIASSYINTGNIYFHLKDYPKALQSFYASLKLEEELNEKYRIALINNNIGEIYVVQENYSKSLINFFLTLKIGKEINSPLLQATAYSNIGKVNEKQANFNESLKNYNAAIDIHKKVNNKHGLAFTLINFSELKMKLNKYEDAYTHLNEALQNCYELGAKDLIKESYNSLAQLDSIQSLWKDAYQHYKLYTIYKDSIDNEEIRKKTITSLLTFHYNKKEAALKAEQEKKDAVAAESKKKQQLVLFLVSCVLALVFVFASFIFRSLRVTRKQKVIIEEKNKDIIDSINYAKRIQDALLKNEVHISKNLPQHFVFYKPKDIVSGDFYWSIEKQGYWYLAVADCTGHGVPGGFMSMLGIAFLNEITANAQLVSPSEILEQLRDKIVKELGQSEKVNQTKDGMDISLVRFHSQTKELQWAGANNSLYFIQNGELKEIKPDKQPIGYHPDMHPFTNHTIQLESGAMFYLRTDGYADQFGGTKGKKFMQKNLKTLLQSIHSESIYEQKEIVAQTFDIWKKDLSQVDDVCIVGVRV